MNKQQRKEWDDIVNESVISLADPEDIDMHETSQMFVDVNKYILHQANNFMVDYVRKKLKVDKEFVPIDVKDFGNTGPSTIPLLLSHLYYKEKPNLEKTILSGFGVGLSWGSIACNLNNTKFYKPIIRLEKDIKRVGKRTK